MWKATCLGKPGITSLIIFMHYIHALKNLKEHLKGHPLVSDLTIFISIHWYHYPYHLSLKHLLLCLPPSFTKLDTRKFHLNESDRLVWHQILLCIKIIETFKTPRFCESHEQKELSFLISFVLSMFKAPW